MNSANYLAQWEKPDVPVSEILLEFSIPRNDAGSASVSLATYFGYTVRFSIREICSFTGFVNLYETSDIRKQLFLKSSIFYISNCQKQILNYYFTKKFQGNPGYVAFRLSEQYLIRAEAAIETQQHQFRQ